MLIAIVNGRMVNRSRSSRTSRSSSGVTARSASTTAKVSKQHARLQSDGGAWYVEDMGSKNGTFVNGVRVVRPCRVKEGDRLRLGQTQVVLSKLSSPERLHAPRMQFAEPAAAQVSVAQPSAVRQSRRTRGKNPVF
jgi:pSer/pThr/pTyr-binding forkhead associated (FHA) protein